MTYRLRRGALLAVALAVAGGCGKGKSKDQNKTDPPATPAVKPDGSSTAPSPAADRIRKAFNQCIEFANAHDVEKYAGCWAADGTSTTVDSGETDTGHEAIAKRMTGTWTALPDAVIESQLLLVNPTTSTSVSIVMVKGTNTGKLGDHEPTGAALGYFGSQVMRWNDAGKIVGSTRFANNVTALGQMGLMPGHRPVPQAGRAVKEMAFSAGTDAEKDNVAAYAGMNSAFNDRKVDDYVAGFSDVAAVRNMLVEKDITAADGSVLEALRTWIPKEWERARGGKRKLLDSWGAGSWVFAHFEISGTRQDKTFAFHAVELARFHGGKVVELWTFADGIALAQQLRPKH